MDNLISTVQNTSADVTTQQEVDYIRHSVDNLLANVEDFMINSKTCNGKMFNESDLPIFKGDEVDDKLNDSSESQRSKSDWSTAISILQQHVADLERLQQLNYETAEVMSEVRKFKIRSALAELDSVEETDKEKENQL